jgi:hypothetical protein
VGRPVREPPCCQPRARRRRAAGRHDRRARPIRGRLARAAPGASHTPSHCALAASWQMTTWPTCWCCVTSACADVGAVTAAACYTAARCRLTHGTRRRAIALLGAGPHLALFRAPKLPAAGEPRGEWPTHWTEHVLNTMRQEFCGRCSWHMCLMPFSGNTDGRNCCDMTLRSTYCRQHRQAQEQR